MTGSGRIADLGRLAEPSLLVLVSLSAGPRHGYGIMTDVEANAGTRLGPGTLYAVLARLERAGLIEALPSDDRRRPYRITPQGAAALRAQLDDLRGLVRLALQRLEAGR